MVKVLDESFLNQIVQQMVRKRNNFGAVLCVSQGGDKFSWIGAAGNLKEDNSYFITSVTKLYVTAVVLRLKQQNKLDLEDSISQYLSKDILQGIHDLNGNHYSHLITIKHLISNKSGIPDYFAYKQQNGETVASNLFNKNRDQSWLLDETLKLVKELEPKFKPGQKVNYSDTNYQLLGRIIENITGLKMSEVFYEYIFKELNLSNTYVFEEVTDTTPVPMYYKSSKIHLPIYMSSITPEGGIVSTAKETMIFLKAFFTGYFFPQSELESLKEWNMVYFPSQFYYGVGLEKLWTPRIISFTNPIKEILGFWGQSGAFAFYNPERDVYFTGTVNQLSGLGHQAAYNAMIKIIKQISN